MGVCVDSACTLGICAELKCYFSYDYKWGTSNPARDCRVADGKAVPPCGACRELMAQLMPEHYQDIEIMPDYEKNRVVTLGELAPECGYRPPRLRWGLFQTKRPLFSAQAFMPCKAFAERLRREKGLSSKIRDAN